MKAKRLSPIDDVERMRRVRRELESRFATVDELFDFIQEQDRLHALKVGARRGVAKRSRAHRTPTRPSPAPAKSCHAAK